MTGRSAIADTVLDAIATMRESGADYAAIALATGVKAKTCQYHALRLGAFASAAQSPCRPPAPYLRAGKLVRPFEPAEDAAIQIWALQGVTLMEMGRRLGRSHNTVLHRLRSLARHDAEMESAA